MFFVCFTNHFDIRDMHQGALATATTTGTSKSNIFIKHNSSFALATQFWYISLTSLHDYDVKFPHTTFYVKAGFHQRRSRSRSRNQKRRAYDLVKTAFRFRLRFRRLSTENQIVGVGSRCRRTKLITTRGKLHCDWLILPLLLPTTTIWFSLDHKRNVSDGVARGVGRKWKRSDSSDSDSVALMTPIFDFHQVISALTIPLTNPTPTPSLVKTSLLKR